MTCNPPTPTSRLPLVGTTIFTTMSALATQHQAINLGQGFPDFDCDPALVEQVHTAMRSGHNQYPPMAGVPVLREAIARKIEALYGHRYDPGQEITVTAGATQALFTAITALVHPGDEVVVLEPCYDSYEPSIVLAGATPVRVPLTPGSFRPDFARLAAAIGPRTRALLLNTPHNPSATVWSADDMEQLAALLRPTQVLVISDEVYEHMVFDGATHASVARHPELAARSVLVSSFGKTYHVTGWKVGYVAAPAALMAEFRKVHQFNVFTVNTPMQYGLAAYMENMEHATGLAAFYQRKRNLFRQGLQAAGLELLPCQGSYFQCVDVRPLTTLSDKAFCEWLTRDIGVAAIPMSAFYANGDDHKVVRFCFAKQDTTLHAALERLQRLAR
ncbi:MAG: pyridoxal phosphate-dependent aminotransferase [Rhodoferax sp.]